MRKSSAFALGLALSALAATARADTCSLRGVVTEASGQPAPSVWIVLSQGPDGPERARSLTTDNGKYYVPSLSPGTYQISVRRGERTLAVEKEVQCSGDQIHDIRLP
jgi:hypothetical protein